jgi:hypothetical protein
MPEYDNTNRGQIWKNSDRKSETHPHFKGSMNIDGVEYWVSAWTRKEDANPKSPALTFSFRKKDAPQDDQIPKTDSVANVSEFDDSIPF